eukprot:4724756-Alexandrium_andersonii.AAC.1
MCIRDSFTPTEFERARSAQAPVLMSRRVSARRAGDWSLGARLSAQAPEVRERASQARCAM